MSEKEIELLKQNIIKQATYFIKEYGEFYPFGFIIDSKNHLKPTNVYLGKENPSTLEVIENLERAYKVGIELQNYIAVSICVDVKVVPPTMNEKIDALEIRLNTNEKESENIYVPYKLLPDGEVQFYDSYSSEGSLNLF
jgi:hypothetical protein